MRLHIFNPENDLALADGGANYCAPPMAECIARDLATLPLWFAGSNDVVYLPGDIHNSYRNEWAKLFQLPAVYDVTMCDNVDSVRPWGWSPQIYRRLKAMDIPAGILPKEESIDAIRRLSNRRSSISILESLKAAGIDTPELPCYLCEGPQIAHYINSRERCVVKAPWSGSGKGIMWGIGRVERPMENFYTGVIKKQGGVLCEEFLNAQVEFAMEFFTDGESVSFAGYSLFKSFKGSYSGNILAGDDDIEHFLSEYIQQNELQKVKTTLPQVLQSLLHGSGYVGYFGVDMMIYKCGESFRLNPCMELNLRMNMGMVAHTFFDRYVANGCIGVYNVNFFKKPCEAYTAHIANGEAYPLEIEGGKITSGYIGLSPVTESSRYSVSVIIYKQKSIEDIY